MIFLNFAHPFTEVQFASMCDMTGKQIDQVIAAPAQFDHAQPFAPQARALIDSVGLTPEQWQTEPLLLNLPSLSVIAGLVVAEVHGRCGYFPPTVRLRPAPGEIPPRFEVAEILDLQGARDSARMLRSSSIERRLPGV